MTTPCTADARALAKAFHGKDPRTPGVLFALLDIYLEEGPFPFDAAKLAARLNTTLTAAAHVNPFQMAGLQIELEEFFEDGDEGWRPSPRYFQTASHARGTP